MRQELHNALSNTLITDPVIITGDLNACTGNNLSVYAMPYPCFVCSYVPLVSHTDAYGQMLLNTSLTQEWTFLNRCANLPTHKFRRCAHYCSHRDYILLNQAASKRYQHAPIIIDASDDQDCHAHLLLCITAKVVNHPDSGLQPYVQAKWLLDHTES